MNSTKNLPNLQNYIKDLLKKKPIIEKAVLAIDNAGGCAYLVGGIVRDLVRQALNEYIKDIDIYDIDIEVHGISMSELENILSKFGTINLVGKSFGVLKISSVNVDWSLPRLDSSGRKPKVQIDEKIDLKTALRRRDLTMNAMAIKILTGELIDPFGGSNDIKDRILRSPDINFFKEDPLRFYRIMQFIGRFNMSPDIQLNNECAKMYISSVSKERIEMEFEKLILLSDRPSLGIRWLHEIERMSEVLPELAQTVTTMQDPHWHPEGSVFEHSMQSLDASVKLTYKSKYEKLICAYAALCHDLGKVTTTKLIDGRLRSLGHDIAGVPIAKQMLHRITTKKDLINSVCGLVKYHMQPFVFEKNNASIAAYKRLANKLAKFDVNIDLLSHVVLADRLGRNGCGHEPLDINVPLLDEFIEKAKRADVFIKPIEPILNGSDIIDIIKPGPLMGKYLKLAYRYQIEKNINDKDILRDYVKKLI